MHESFVVASQGGEKENKTSILLKKKYPFENVLTSLIKFPIFLLVFSVAFMKYPKTNKTI